MSNDDFDHFLLDCKTLCSQRSDFQDKVKPILSGHEQCTVIFTSRNLVLQVIMDCTMPIFLIPMELHDQLEFLTRLYIYIYTLYTQRSILLACRANIKPGNVGFSKQIASFIQECIQIKLRCLRRPWNQTCQQVSQPQNKIEISGQVATLSFSLEQLAYPAGYTQVLWKTIFMNNYTTLIKCENPRCFDCHSITQCTNIVMGLVILSRCFSVALW